MPDQIPTTKIQAAIFLCHAEEHLSTERKDFRTYDDLKARQLCSTLADLLMGEVKFESWMADLGTGGCSL